jgi:hypothetical protein
MMVYLPSSSLLWKTEEALASAARGFFCNRVSWRRMAHRPATMFSVQGRIVFAVVVSVFFALLAMMPAQADFRILSSPGGAVDSYLAAFAPANGSSLTGLVYPPAHLC